MLNSKQRARLRSMANKVETIMQIGKGGINENILKQVEDALLARELIKVRVLENSIYTAKEAAVEIAEAVNCEVVQVMGSRITFYKRHPKEPQINLDE